MQRELHNLWTDLAMMRTELKCLIAAKVVETARLEPQPGHIPAEILMVYVWSGLQPSASHLVSVAWQFLN